MRDIPCFLAIVLVPAVAWGGLLAEYRFNDGTAGDETGSYNLNTVGTGITYHLEGAKGYARFPGDDDEPSYLEVEGPGGMPQFTVSIWLRTPQRDQGEYQGVFSNNRSSTADYSWQFGVHDGTMRVRSAVSGFDTITFGSLPVDEWTNVIVQKTSSDSAEVFLNGQSVGAEDTNPGGLQWLRVGTNRNTSAFYAMDVDEVKVWDSLEDAAAIYAQGTAFVPEPATIVLVGMGLAVSARRRRRRERL
ncbi:MAG: LamG-like jellyroll fold domain-containing protein [Candidatus Brocadiia bacterium]